jgi:hypothetical protein
MAVVNAAEISSCGADSAPSKSSEMASSNAVNKSSVSVSSVFSALSTTDVNPADATTEDYFPLTSIPIFHLISGGNIL